MSTPDPVRVALIGCGNIAGPYADDLVTYPEITLAGVADLDAARATTFAAEHETQAYPSVDALLADPAVELVVNLTTHHAHYPVTAQCLQAGKHVYSEKPLALTTAEAAELVALARERGLRLACSPFTLIGEAQQTAWRLLRDGRLGTVRVAFAEVNWGRIESWHPAPEAFYDVGALFDVGVYPLGILTGIFGPARRVTAYGAVLHPDRVTKEGVPFHVTTPDFVVAAIEFQAGPLVRLTTDFYVANESTRQTGIEFHGDRGSLHLESWGSFRSPLWFAPFGQPLEPAPLVREPYPGIPWGRGVWETATALRAGRPHRFSGEQAAHITEILCAVAEAVRTGAPVAITSDFPAPVPMEWATAGSA